MPVSFRLHIFSLIKLNIIVYITVNKNLQNKQINASGTKKGKNGADSSNKLFPPMERRMYFQAVIYA